MHKKNLFTIFIAVFLISCTRHDSSVTSLSITIPTVQNGIAPHKRRAVFIKQTIQLNHCIQDTIYLHMDSRNAFCACFLGEWTSAKYHNKPINKELEELQDFFQFQLSLDDIDYTNRILYQKDQLIIPIPQQQRKHTITIQYRFISNQAQTYYAYPNRPTESWVRTDYDYDHSRNISWYFTTDNMQLQNVSFHLPLDDSLCILSNYNLSRTNDGYDIDFCHSTKEDGIWFSIVDEQYCVKQTDTIGNITINFYSQKYFDIDQTTWQPINVVSPSYSIVKQDLRATKEICKQVCVFFNDSSHRVINVFKCQRGPGNCSASISNNHNYNVIQDSTIFDNSYYAATNYFHEFVHCFLAYPADDDDTIKYLFAEGMTVFCSACMGYINGYETLSDLDTRMAKYYDSLSEEAKQTPILGINYNTPSAHAVIYRKCPYVFYLFAQRVGVERFINLVREYYVQLRESRSPVTLANFEQFLESHDVSKDDWNYFISILK